MTVAAVVVRWRGGDEVRRCLESLHVHGRPLLSRVVLVDSGSGDGGAEQLAAAIPRTELLALPDNRSFAFAADRGVDHCDEPLLLLLNPDAELLPGSLEPLVAFLGAHPETAGAVPALEHHDGSSQHRWQLRRLPRSLELATGRGGAAAFRHLPSVPVPVPQPAASAWLLRRRVWNELGGLDPLFAPAWWEDVDFCARLARSTPSTQGFWVLPSSRIRHGGGSSLERLPDADFLIAYHRNLLRYAERHQRTRLGLIRRGLRVSLAVRAALRPGRRQAYLRTVKELFG